MEQATAPTVSMEKALMQELVAQPQALLFNKQGFTVKDILKWYSENGYPAPNKVPKDEIPTEFLLPAEAPTVLLTGALPSMTEQQGMSSQSSQDTGFKLGKVDIPSWDGSESRRAKYKLDAKRLQSSLPVKDHQYISATPNGILLVEPELIGAPQHKTANGHWLLTEHLVQKMGITAIQTEQSKFHDYHDYFYSAPPSW